MLLDRPLQLVHLCTGVSININSTSPNSSPLYDVNSCGYFSCCVSYCLYCFCAERVLKQGLRWKVEGDRTAAAQKFSARTSLSYIVAGSSCQSGKTGCLLQTLPPLLKMSSILLLSAPLPTEHRRRRRRRERPAVKTAAKTTRRRMPASCIVIRRNSDENARGWWPTEPTSCTSSQVRCRYGTSYCTGTTGSSQEPGANGRTYSVCFKPASPVASY